MSNPAANMISKYKRLNGIFETTRLGFEQLYFPKKDEDVEKNKIRENIGVMKRGGSETFNCRECKDNTSFDKASKVLYLCKICDLLGDSRHMELLYHRYMGGEMFECGKCEMLLDTLLCATRVPYLCKNCFEKGK